MNKKTLFFEGSFQLWVYDVTHGLLLLRRNATQNVGKRVDIVFKDVRSLQVCTFLESITIEEIDPTEVAGKTLVSERTKEPGLRWFRIISREGEGYICASGYRFHEDSADIGEASAIYEPGLLLVKLAVKSSWYKEKYGTLALTDNQEQ